MTYLLDTDVVIDHLTGQPQTHALLVRLLPQGAAISVITYSEIFEGVFGSDNPQAAAMGFQTFLRGMRVIGIPRTVAKRNAQLRLDLRRRKHPITNRALDLLIAATAIEHGLILITRNQQDYDDIPVLSLYNWAEDTHP